MRARLGLCCALLLLVACSERSVSLAPGAQSTDAPGDQPNLLSRPLLVATPQVALLTAEPHHGAQALSANLANWRGEPAHLAGTAHYDRGEWIYEDHPWTAYGAASAPMVALYQLLETLGNVSAPAERLPGGIAFLIAQAGAGPFVEEADISELRLAVRGDELHVMARTTSMFEPVRTALLLLFDTGRAGAELSVPFGSGLTTSAADTAVLVTASGAKIVDLTSGVEIDAPSASDATDYNNALAANLPLALVSKSETELRLVAASGLAAPGVYTLDAGGAGGPVAKVVPRFEEPVQSTYERQQALALAARNIDRFFVTVSLERLRAGEREQLRPGPGYNVRTFLAPPERGSEGGSNGTLRQYGLYVPLAYTGEEAVPATLLFRGSSMTAHGLAAITPGLIQNLGDDNGALVISPCGRSGFDVFQGAVYADVMQTLADAQALLPIDADRISLAGYSMGGYATYMFAVTQPDLFSGAFVIEGLIGGARPATALISFPDLVPLLQNALHLPIQIFQGDVDVNVPIIHALAATRELRRLDYRYRFNLLPANTHFSPGIQNDYSIGARYLKQTRRAAAPARVHYARSMPVEREVDTGASTDQPGAGQSQGLKFDHAWYVRDLQASDAINGTATVDMRTHARPEGTITPKWNAGVDVGPLTGQPLSPYEEVTWEIGEATDAPRNAFDAVFTGTAHAALVLEDMALRVDEPLSANIRSDAPITLTLRLPQGACLALPEGVNGEITAAAVTLSLAAGEHALTLSPCR